MVAICKGIVPIDSWEFLREFNKIISVDGGQALLTASSCLLKNEIR